MTPYALFDTPIGRCGIAWGDAGVRCVQLPMETDAALHASFLARFVDAEPAPPSAAIVAVIELLTRHLSGDPRDLSTIPLDMSEVPPFHRKVYEVSRAIGPGKTRGYGELAAELGSKGAARAVGQAMGKNPFAIVVPCHRVLAAGKKPGGFSAYGGTETKAKMLALEGLALDVPRGQRSLLEGPAPRALPFDAEEAVRHVGAKDKRLAKLIERVGPLRLKLEETQGTFEALAESIVYQQLTGKAAATIFGRVKALFPRKLVRPEALLAIPDEALRGAGLSGNKLRALRDLAEKSADGTVPHFHELHALEDDVIVDRLTAVRGIGRWTVEMLLIFRLGRPDVLPVHDYGVRKGFARVYGKKELPSPKDLTAFAERWRPFRTVASWYMWRAAELT